MSDLIRCKFKGNPLRAAACRNWFCDPRIVIPVNGCATASEGTQYDKAISRAGRLMEQPVEVPVELLLEKFREAEACGARFRLNGALKRADHEAQFADVMRLYGLTIPMSDLYPNSSRRPHVDRAWDSGFRTHRLI